jgi:hypothetical protein
MKRPVSSAPEVELEAGLLQGFVEVLVALLGLVALRLLTAGSMA